MCLFSEAAQHANQAVQNKQPVVPMHIKAQHDIDSHSWGFQDSVETDSNPYEAALTREVKCHVSQDPMTSLKGTSFALSLFSTEVTYTVHSGNVTAFLCLPDTSVYRLVECTPQARQPLRYLNNF